MRVAAGVIGLFLATTLVAHTIAPHEVIDYLNSKEVREACGVTRAAQVAGRADLLLIEINGKWFRLPAERRVKLATEWRDLWQHTVKTRRVSIVDAQSKPVVHYLADGRVAVVDQEK